MDFNAIIAAIGSVGFPIVACIYLFYLYNKQIEVVADLKVVLQKLISKLDLDIEIKKEDK